LTSIAFFVGPLPALRKDDPAGAALAIGAMPRNAAASKQTSRMDANEF